MKFSPLTPTPTLTPSQTKPPFYFPSPSNIRRFKSPDFPKPTLVFSPNYSNTSNTKNSSYKEKVEKSQNSSAKDPEELIQRLEEKLERSLKENIDLTQTLNFRSKELEDEKKNGLGLRAKVRELEGVLGLYTREKLGFENIIREKDDEIDETKEKLQEFKEKYMKLSYIELQLENYRDVIDELQHMVSEKDKELKFREAFFSNLIDNEKLGFLNETENLEVKIKKLIEKIRKIEAKNQDLTENHRGNTNFEDVIAKLMNEIGLKNREIKLLNDIIENEKFQFLAKNETLDAKIGKIIEKLKENEKKAKENKMISDLIENEKYPFFNKIENIEGKVSKIIEKLKESDKKNKELGDLLEKNKGKETLKNIQEAQLKQLREIDKRNKMEIERMFGLLNARKGEVDRLQEENRQIMEKYNVSLQKIKNLEHFFSQNFTNTYFFFFYKMGFFCKILKIVEVLKIFFFFFFEIIFFFIYLILYIF